MKIGYALLASSVVALLLWGSGSVAQTPDGQDAQSPSSAPSVASTRNRSTSSSNKQKSQKEKHWTGSLVDANCMAKVMSGAAAATDQGSNRPDASSAQTQSPELIPENPVPQAGRSSSGQMGPGQSRQAGPLPPGQNPDQNPDMSQAQAAQMARANKVNNEAKQCVASATTTVFGLVLAGGQVVRLNDEGNAKAGEALKAISIEPGKPVKAKVTGTLEGSDTAKVASVEIKGKRSSSASATQGGG